MTKKLILPALLFAFAALCTTNSLGQCTSGVNPEYIAVGSSAQFNSFSFAAVNILTTAGNGVNFWASSSLPLKDFNANVTDTAKAWIAWDNQATCNVYAYYSVDSTIGVKTFFSYKKVTQNGVTNADVAAAYIDSTQNPSWAACSGTTAVNAGQPVCSGEGSSTGVPTQIQTFLTTQPGPTCKISGTTCTATKGKSLPYAYCGQNSTVQTTAKFCMFNAGHADIRPEDTLYANTRALSSYNSTGGLAGLGYNSTVCGSNGGTTATIGCPFLESFGKGGTFNTVKFALTGTDPIGLAALPTYTTLNVGAAPVVVIVSDSDASGLGAGAPDYTVTNVNRSVLAGIENGTFGCVGDLEYNGNGSGKPLQILHREALSGTYNTFEFTGVRQQEASAALAISDNKQTTSSWFTANDSGQEQVMENAGGPGLNFGTCGNATTPPSSACGDPLYAAGVSCGGTASLNLRVIGTGEMVKVVAGTNSNKTGSAAVPDAFGYAFWGYGNMAPMDSGCGTNSGTVNCSSYLAHYLTVDGIDPLFITPGGANDPTPNPNGAYHAPACYLSSGSPACFAIPFTHMKDGSYPLWTILRLVTFNTVTTGTAQQTTPAAVLSILAQAEAVAGDETKNLDDFVPYYTNINTSNNTGDLNLFVLRSHYKATGDTINPNNGIASCAGTYTGLSINGAAGTCGVDAGDDVGGAIITVNADADFHADFNGVGTNPSEYFGLHN